MRGLQVGPDPTIDGGGPKLLAASGARASLAAAFVATAIFGFGAYSSEAPRSVPGCAIPLSLCCMFPNASFCGGGVPQKKPKKIAPQPAPPTQPIPCIPAH